MQALRSSDPIAVKRYIVEDFEPEQKVSVMACWELTWKERLVALFTGKVVVHVRTEHKRNRWSNFLDFEDLRRQPPTATSRVAMLSSVHAMEEAIAAIKRDVIQ